MRAAEFPADFTASDIARLARGMAALGMAARVFTDAEFTRVLMKAVYGKTRTLADKAAVDFALARLADGQGLGPDGEANEARSMHYDPRCVRTSPQPPPCHRHHAT